MKILKKFSLKQPENIFLFLSLFFGIIFIFITPPFQAPDERVHYFRAYQISEGYLVKTNAPINSSLIDYSSTIGRYNLPFNPDNKISKKILILSLLENISSKDKNSVSTSPTNSYSPIGYLPQVFGILIGKLIGFSQGKIFYLARLVNLLTSVMFIIISIRFLPFGKWILISLSLMPMALFLLASNSPDALLISTCFLFIAYFLYFLDKKEELSSKNIKLFLSTALLLSFLKTGYAVLNILLLFFTKKPFILKKDHKILFIFIFLLSNLINFGWIYISSNINGPSSIPIPGVDVFDQLFFVVNQPFSFIYIFFTDLINDSVIITKMFVGILGWLDTYLPNSVYLLNVFILVFSFFFDNKKNNLSLQERFFILLCFSILFSFYYSIFYLTWTPVRATYIQGFQGRYLIPIAPLLLIILQVKWISFTPKFISIITSTLIVISLISTQWVLILRYYYFP